MEPEINPVSRNISVLNSRMIKEEREINTLSTDLRRLDLDPKKLQKRFGRSLDVAANTLKATTQHAFRDVDALSRRYKTAIQQLRYRRLTRGTATHSSLAFYPQEETDTARSSRTAKVGIYLSHEVEI
jgi:hypothetical protein